MKEDRLKKYLDELSEETDFDFSISEIKNGEVELYMQGDNPCNEDWCTEITIKNPKTKKELIETLHEKMWELYDDFDVEEETNLMLEAKRNGFQGVPGVVDLVHKVYHFNSYIRQRNYSMTRFCFWFFFFYCVFCCQVFIISIFNSYNCIFNFNCFIFYINIFPF